MPSPQQLSKQNQIRMGIALPLQLLETPGELDVLPLKAIVREIYNQRPLNGDQGKTWERRRTGWYQISGLSHDERQQPALPVCLLWHPRWRTNIG